MVPAAYSDNVLSPPEDVPVQGGGRRGGWQRRASEFGVEYLDHS